MNDAGSRRTDSAVRLDVSHDIVTTFLFLGRGALKVDIFNMRFQLGNLFVGDAETESLHT